MSVLVIYGPQGSGKSTTARAIAAGRGKFAEIEGRQLEESFWPWMTGQTKTVVIDGPIDARAAVGLRRMLGAGLLLLDRRFEPSVLVAKPELIICVDSLAELERLLEPHGFSCLRANLGAAQELARAQTEARRRDAFDTLPDDYEVN